MNERCSGCSHLASMRIMSTRRVRSPTREVFAREHGEDVAGYLDLGGAAQRAFGPDLRGEEGVECGRIQWRVDIVDVDDLRARQEAAGYALALFLLVGRVGGDRGDAAGGDEGGDVDHQSFAGACLAG